MYFFHILGILKKWLLQIQNLPEEFCTTLITGKTLLQQLSTIDSQIPADEFCAVCGDDILFLCLHSNCIRSLLIAIQFFWLLSYKKIIWFFFISSHGPSSMCLNFIQEVKYWLLVQQGFEPLTLHSTGWSQALTIEPLHSG